MVPVTREPTPNEHAIRLSDGQLIVLKREADAVTMITPRGEELVLPLGTAWEFAEMLDWLATRTD